MQKIIFSFLLYFTIALIPGCGESKPAVIVDQRPEEEIQKELEDYDKQMAEEAQSYEQQNN